MKKPTKCKYCALFFSPEQKEQHYFCGAAYHNGKNYGFAACEKFIVTPSRGITR